MEFQIPSIDRAAKVLQKDRGFFTSFTSYDFLKFEKVDPLPFVAKSYFLYKTYLKYLSIHV